MQPGADRSQVELDRQAEAMAAPVEGTTSDAATQPACTEGHFRWGNALPFGLAGLCALIVALVYLPGLRYQFVWDDTIFLRDLPAYRNPELWLDSLFRPFVLSPNYFRPLAILTFVGELRLGGLDPAVFHATNLLLHALNTALVALLAWRVLQDRDTARRIPAPAAWILPVTAGLLYGLHPALIEGVAFISSRFDLLMTAFLLLALLADGIGRSTVDPKPSSQLRRALWVGICFLLGAFSKEMAVAFALGLPAWHVAVGVEKNFRQFIKRNQWVYLSVLLGGVVYLGIRLVALRYLLVIVGERTIAVGPILHHGLLVFKSLGEYLGLVVFPFVLLKPIHFSQFPVSASDAAAWLALFAVIGAAIGVVALIRKHPPTGWLVLVGVVALLPVANLLPLELGGGAYVAERFLLFPMVFFALAPGFVIRELAPGLRRWVGIAASLWLVLSLGTIQLTLPNWQDNATLWNWAIQRAPGSELPPTNLALELIDRGQYRSGATFAQQAIALNPENADAWDNFGLALFYMGDYASAQAAFERAVSIQPDNALYWNNLAGALREQDKLADAAQILIEKVFSLDPNLPTAHLNLGIVYLKADRPDLAANALQNALKLLVPAQAVEAQAFLSQTQEPDRWVRMGERMMQAQEYLLAVQAFDSAAQLGAPYGEAAVGVSDALIAMEDWQTAAQMLEEAIQRAPQEARLYNNLGIVAREQGDLEKARQMFTKALELMPQWEAPRMNLEALPPR